MAPADAATTPLKAVPPCTIDAIGSLQFCVNNGTRSPLSEITPVREIEPRRGPNTVSTGVDRSDKYAVQRPPKHRLGAVADRIEQVELLLAAR
jgi:hypothetical protein